ncbi:MAG: methylated-DNA--[protein]-cysteine S-methyltransferase [Chloroflexota bacterium]
MIEERLYDAGLASPVGALWVARSPLGVCRVGIGLSEERWRALVEGEFGLPPVRDEALLDDVVAALRAYCAGQRTRFDLPLDLRRGSAFQQRVWEAARRIPWGHTRTYGQLAQMIGAPGAARAVGQALHRNPVPILVPCHRIVARGGAGGFALGLEIKRALLALEGVALTQDETRCAEFELFHHEPRL